MQLCVIGLGATCT